MPILGSNKSISLHYIFAVHQGCPARPRLDRRDEADANPEPLWRAIMQKLLRADRVCTSPLLGKPHIYNTLLLRSLDVSGRTTSTG